MENVITQSQLLEDGAAVAHQRGCGSQNTYKEKLQHNKTAQNFPKSKSGVGQASIMPRMGRCISKHLYKN